MSAADTGKKVGYLKGLLEGMDFSDKETRRKLLHGIVDVLGDLSDRADNMTDLIVDLNDYVESIDDDLSSLEDGDSPIHIDEDYDEDDELFGGKDTPLRLLDDDDEDDDDEDDEDDEDWDDDMEGDEIVDVGVCPECGQPFLFEFNMLDEETGRYACPHCGKVVEPENPSEDNMKIAKRID